jgi:hypothetical protein
MPSFCSCFWTFVLLHSRRRLDETPTITHGATLVLKRWKVDQAIHWSSCYGRLSTEEIKTMFWNFDTSRFQTTRPTSTGSLRLPLSSETSPIPDMAMMVHDDGDSSNRDSSCTTLQPIPRWVLGRGQLANIHHGPTEALLLAYPAPSPQQISQSFINRFTDCDLIDLPNNFPTILLQFECQRFFQHAPSEALSCEIFNFHASVYQHLLLLSHLQLQDLMQFRALLSIWLPSYPYHLNPIATAFLPHCHLIVEGGTLGVTQAAHIIASVSTDSGDTPEDRLLRVKGIECRPLRWFATRKSSENMEDHDVCCIVRENYDLQPVNHDKDIPYATSVILGLITPLSKSIEVEEAIKTGTPNTVKPLDAKAKSWFPKPEFSRPAMSDWSENNRTYTVNESKTCVEIYPKNDRNLRSQISPLVLPVFCSPPTRNGGYTFFADGKDYEAYDPLQPNDNALSFLDQASLPKIYSQVKHKTKKLLEIDSKGVQ